MEILSPGKEGTRLLGAAYLVLTISLANLTAWTILDNKLGRITSTAFAILGFLVGITEIWGRTKGGEKHTTRIQEAIDYLKDNNLSTPEAIKVLADHIQNDRGIIGDISKFLQKHSGLLSVAGTSFINQLLNLGPVGAATFLLLIGAYLAVTGTIQAITIFIDPGIATRELIVESLRHEITLEIMSQKIKAGPPNTR